MTQEYYFKTTTEWRNWLEQNYQQNEGIYLIFFKKEHPNASMLWEEAVKVALCFGWIDATVKSLGNGKRKQYYCKRNPKSAWSALNKNYIKQLTHSNKMHQSGLKAIQIAKQNGSWNALDAVEQRIIPKELKAAFLNNNKAFTNFKNLAPSYQKNYLYWLFQAKRPATRNKRIEEIIALCEANKKTRN